ncbi:MAG: M48 family metalloprotease [Hydrococcus sp. C42_A2020_068]|nr:M48 family metalloprotease [Hydrococcus sp. C42_A2020_068]
MKSLRSSFLIALGVLLPTPAVFAQAFLPSIAAYEEQFSSQPELTFSTSLRSEVRRQKAEGKRQKLEGTRQLLQSKIQQAQENTTKKDCNKPSDSLLTFTDETIPGATLELALTVSLPPLAIAQNSGEGEISQIDSFEVETAKLPIPSLEKIVRNKKLAQGDRLYACGELSQAEKVYREAKEPFPAEIAIEREKIPEPIYQPEQLPPGGAVYWRMYQQGRKDKRLESKIFAPLQLLTEQYPEFIPGHLHYERSLAEAGKKEEAMQVLQHAATLYPNEAELVRSQIKAYQDSEDWLEASLTARQFASFNPGNPQAAEFTRIANENLARYQDKLESDITWNAVGNAIVGGLGFALTGNIFGPLSALETAILLLEGESSIGDRFSERIQEELPMMQDEEVLGYVRGIGNKLADVAGRDEFDYQFYVIMDDRLNAFALPGGKVFLNAGAILDTNSEAELAGLLAHELAHAVLSHGFQLMAEGNLTASVTQYIPYVGNVAGDLIVLNYSREMEEQADVFGTRLLAANGYAADGVRNLMVTLNEEEDPGIPAWFSTHPDAEDRVRYLEEAIVRQRLNRYAYEGIDRHQQIKERVAKLLGEYQQKQQTEE